MKILVLGSEGQIGQYLCEGALKARHVLKRMDLELGYDLRSSFHNDHITNVFESADMVYFLAFDVGGSSYLADRQFSYPYINNNIRLMDNVFRILRHTGTPFIFASSQMSNMLESSYGMLKRIGEFYAQALGGITVRFWNVYGEEKHPEKFHVISDFIEGARSGSIQMRTDGLEMRQFLHGRDCADALLKLCDHYSVLDPMDYYDVTSFQWTTIKALADTIGRMCGAKVIPGISQDHTQTKQNEPTDKILEFWKPKISLEDGIKELLSLERQ